MTEKEITTASINIFNTLAVDSLFNSYAIECVTMGFLKPNDKIPFEKFVSDLELDDCVENDEYYDLEGYAIDENQKVVNENYDYFAKECLYSALYILFSDAPLNTRTDDDDGVMDYKDGLRDYIKSLYPLFRQIVTTNVQYDSFDIINFVDKQQYKCFRKLLFDIKVKKLKKGTCVNNYFKNVQNVPCYIQRLVEVKNGKYILVNNDTENLDYKLALLSVLVFVNPEHAKLFELKMQQWEQNNSK